MASPSYQRGPWEPKPRYKPRPMPRPPYVDPSRIQYIVEYRPCRSGERYLLTQKMVTEGALQGPAVLKSTDPVPNESNNELGTIRPVIVGTIDPHEGYIIYYADQDPDEDEEDWRV